MDVCFFDKDRQVVIDDIIAGENGQIGKWSGKTLEELQVEHDGNIVVLTYAEAGKIIEQKFISQPERTTEECYREALECLPPCRWSRTKIAEIFHSSEMTSGSVTSWYVCIEGDYWHLSDSICKSRDEILSLVIYAGNYSDEMKDKVMRAFTKTN